jgi:tetratricopeptide (TPR) repeat protein
MKPKTVINFIKPAIVLYICWLNNFGIIKINAQIRPADTAAIALWTKKGDSFSEGPVDSSIAYYQKAIKLLTHYLHSEKNISKKALETLTSKLISIELKTGLAYYQQTDYTSAMKHYQNGYSYALKQGDPKYVGECLFDFAEVSLEKCEFTKAMTYYFQSLQEYRKANDPDGEYWCYLGIGIVQKQCGNFKDAVECYEKALSIALKAKMDPEIAYCHNNLGNVYRNQGDFVKSMASYEKAITCFQKMKDDLSVSDCLNNIGNLFIDKKDAFRALDYYNRSLNFEKVKKDKYRLVIRYKNLAGAYFALNDNSNATIYLDKAIKLAEGAGEKLELASCYAQIAAIHLSNGAKEIAISYYQKSCDIFQTLGMKSQQAENLILLADAERKAGNIENAKKHAEQGEQLAKTTGSLQILLLASESLSKIWEQKGNPQQALKYLKEAKLLQDSTFNKEKNRTIEEIEAGFTRIRLENENQILAQNSLLQQQSLRIKNILVGSLIVCLVLSILILWLLYKRHVDSKLLATQNNNVKEQEIEKLNEDLSSKERELTTKTLFIHQKNELLQNLIQELDKLKQSGDNPHSNIDHLQFELKQELSPNAWKEFEVQFNEVHPGFQNCLLEKFPDLTPGERRLCAFLRLDMNTREITSLTGQTSKSIEVARTRIRKKLNLSREDNLTNFIANM